MASLDDSVRTFGPAADVDAVMAANGGFYDAFERRDFDGMSDVWEHSDRVLCTHPGWPTLRGWGGIVGSWMRLLSNQQHLQFILTNMSVAVDGDVGWVSHDENILDGTDSSTVATTHIFVRAPDAPRGWLMVAHHGSLVHASLA